MTQTTLTSTQSKAARAALGISQSKAAQATGINRSQLALFEVQKFLLDDAKLKALRAYYESLGYEFDAKATKPGASRDDPRAVSEDIARDAPSDSRIVDRFVVPAGLEDEALEELIDEIDSNDRKIAELAPQQAEIDWFSGEPKPAARDEILRLMARNYLRVRQLQCGGFAEQSQVATEKRKQPTKGELVSQAIGLPVEQLFADQ